MASHTDIPTIIPPQRSALRKREGQTFQVTAVFARKGKRTGNGHIYPTVLIKNIQDAASGELLADHLWFNAGKIWPSTHLRSGDTVQFVARAIEYRTGYWGPGKLIRRYDPPRVDYKLTPPQDLNIITRKKGRPRAQATRHPVG